MECNKFSYELHVYAFKETLKQCNWLTRKCWMVERLELLRMQSHWGKYEAPFFPFGYRNDIWFSLAPDPYIIVPEFYVRSGGPFPSGVGDDSIFFLKFQLQDDCRQLNYGFACAQLGRIRWRLGPHDLTSHQLGKGPWQPSPLVALVEIMENGCPGPIWLLRFPVINNPQKDGDKFDAEADFCGLGLVKVANSIDDVGANEWPEFQEISAGNLEFLPLYQTARKGPLQVLWDRDEQMEEIPDDDDPLLMEISPAQPKSRTSPVTFMRNHWAGINGVFFSSFFPS